MYRKLTESHPTGWLFSFSERLFSLHILQQPVKCIKNPVLMVGIFNFTIISESRGL
jgi:hypothetical protein